MRAVVLEQVLCLARVAPELQTLKMHAGKRGGSRERIRERKAKSQAPRHWVQTPGGWSQADKRVYLGSVEPGDTMEESDVSSGKFRQRWNI